MKLEVALLAGPETKAVLVELKGLVDRLESLSKGGVVAKPATAQVAQAAVEEFENEVSESAAGENDDFMSEGEAEPPKKLTVADVNEACKAKARTYKKDGVAEVKKILKKNFKTESISALKESQYAKALEVLAL